LSQFVTSPYRVTLDCAEAAPAKAARQEATTMLLFIVCSETGWLDQSQPHVLVLCEHHKQQRVQGVLDPWFSDEKAARALRSWRDPSLPPR
jgi:hypothetical protein